MNSILLTLVSIFIFAAAPLVSAAAPLKTYVSEFNVAGAQNKDELKQSLQGMLASRLKPGRVTLVDSQDKADLLINGSYSLFGKIFSLDVLLKNNVAGTLTKVFEQGNSEDDLIPAINRLAQKIDQELAKETTLPEPVPVNQNSGTSSAAPVVAKPESYAAPQAGSYVIRSDDRAGNSQAGWTSEPLEGVFTAIALGRLLPSGESEIFVANDHAIRLYLKGAGLKLVAEVAVPIPARILAIDTADLDSDGIPELYATIMDRETLSSRVYRADGTSLVKIAENLPWFFRGIGPDMKTRFIYVQTIWRRGEFYGDVSELAKKGERFEEKNPLKLPRYGKIFNFNLITDPSGKKLFAVLNEDGYLVISKPDGEELWKSIDKFGGSETCFKNKDYTQIVNTGDPYRLTFLEQRMVSLPDGTLLVPRNEGIFAIGNNRAYDKYTMFGLQWKGSKLSEKWHSRQETGYLADFGYASASREVVLLEVIQKGSFSGGGKTVISFNRLD